MVLNDDGEWSFDDWVDRADEDWKRYRALLRKWNQFVPDYNALVRPRNVGRPLEASDAQRAQVLKLHKGGMSGAWTRRRSDSRRCAPSSLSATAPTARRASTSRASTPIARLRCRGEDRSALAMHCPSASTRLLATGKEPMQRAKGLR